MKQSRKGVLLAGGTGTRLWPMTTGVSKQMLPVYDRPLIYFPLSTLMLAGIRELLIISTPSDLPRFKQLLGSGVQFGVDIGYAEQRRPEGIAQALMIAESFIDGCPSALILGDNLFHGSGLAERVKSAGEQESGATVFAYSVVSPQQYGVIELDHENRPISIQEKPKRPRSNLAVTGLYFYDSDAPAIARTLKPSTRGELEITDLNRRYLEEARLSVEILGPGIAWLDTGTPDALLDASNYIAALERRQRQKAACPEEIAWRAGWIDDEALLEAATNLRPSAYGSYLEGLLS